MSEPPTSPRTADAQETPRIAAAALPTGIEPPAPVQQSAARKRDRESALGSGAVTPNSAEESKGFSLTPVAKKGRVQDASSSPRQLREPLRDDASKADVEIEEELSPSPPETPPGQLSVSPSQRGALPPVTAPETGRVANIRQKVQRMSTGGDEDFAEEETASNASSHRMPDDQPPLSAVRAETLPIPIDAAPTEEIADEDMASVRAPSPAAGASEAVIEPDVPSVPPIASGLPATPSPTKPVSTFASFSKSTSPFAAVPSSSRPSFGGSKLSSALSGKVLPLSQPNVQALVNATGDDVGPPSPASSVRAEIGSIAPVSRSVSFSGSTRADSLGPEAPPTVPSPLVVSEITEEPVEAIETLEDAKDPESAASPVATGLGALPAVSAPAAAPSASSFAARFAGSTSAFGKAKTASTGSSAFGSFSSSASSPFGSVRKSPYPPGRRRPSQEVSPEREKDKSFGDLLKGESESKVESGSNGEDAVPKMLFKEQEVVTGEEDEELLHSVRGKLYVMEGGSWRERGLGQLRLNAKYGGGQPRLVMRADATHRLLLNAALFPGFQIKASDRQVQFGTVEDGAFTSWALKVSNAQTSAATVSAVQAALDSLPSPSGPPTSAAEAAV